MIDLRKGDCLELMKDIRDKSIDAIITDPPYQITACKWDSVIDFDLMWEQLNRIIKPNGAIVLFGSQPFTTDLINSNRKMFKYEYVWVKNNCTNLVQAKRMPLRAHENILVFYKEQPIFNATKIKRTENELKRISRNSKTENKKEDVYLKAIGTNMQKRELAQYKLADDVLHINSVHGRSKNKVAHPTQKPIELMEYLIKTYTNKNETVLDNTMGSGTTGVACVNTNRNFIGIEKDEKYFDIAQKRINEALMQMNVTSF